MASPSDKGKPKTQQGNSSEAARATPSAPVPYQRGAVAPYGAWQPFHQLRQDFDRLFDRLFRGWATPWEEAGPDWHWGFDLEDRDDNLVVRAEAPGFEPGDFDLQVRGDQLILRAAHKAEADQPERGEHEWQQREFYRSVTLPSGVAADKVQANYRNGVLTVTLPKTEAGKGRHITVQG